MLKHADLRRHSVLEVSAYILMGYVPYVLAAILGLSGIVAVLVAGMTTRSYGHKNLSSKKTQESAEFIYRVLSFLADNAVFLYLGTTVFGLKGLLDSLDWAFIGWSLFSCLISRAAVVVSLSLMINLLVPFTGLNVISCKNQIVLWFAGLRGAVAFAAATVFPNSEGNAGKVLTTTMAIILFFNFVVAPLTMPLIKGLKLQMNVQHTRAR